MNLDEAQRQQVGNWIEEGLKLSEIQSKLASEYGLRMTYMEVRFLIDDLKLKPKDKEPPPASLLTAKTPPAAKGAALPPSAKQPPTLPSGATEDDAGPVAGVSVAVDQVTRPGAVVSGKVTFSDGQSAEWYLDQFGRLGVVARQQGYKPSQADLMAFQAELQNELAKLGY